MKKFSLSSSLIAYESPPLGFQTPDLGSAAPFPASGFAPGGRPDASAGRLSLGTPSERRPAARHLEKTVGHGPQNRPCPQTGPDSRIRRYAHVLAAGADF